MAAIATDRLTKRFSSSTTAVDHVNITVEEGEVYGLLGRNGAGKSTLMGMLLGLLEPTSGSFQSAQFINAPDAFSQTYDAS